ncbi:MAG TPA: DUF1549 and DUF1553 domain-containing protein [Planctomycetota bacterium]|nr:DUF1549 and DUF1553 domain-containing protein [Planctomycetota bacterium]
MRAFVLAMLAGLAAAPDKTPLRGVIDREVRAEWERQKLSPAPLCDDAAFHRRVHLDLVGSIPTYEETVAFLKDGGAGRRAALVDRLLEDPRYPVHQAAQWDLVFFGRNPASSEVRKRESFQKWLAERFAKNVPYDAWVRDLILAEGNTFEQGAPTFLYQFRGQALETAEAVSKIILGTQIRCARCHDHPSDTWTQKDFYGFAAFFARLTVIDGGGSEGKKKYFLGEKSTGEIMFTGPAKDAKPGQKGEPITAKYLRGPALEEPALPKDFKEPDFRSLKTAPPRPRFSRKERAAAWITSPENPFFTRAVVNRVWAQLFGRGFVNPVDDLREDRPGSHPELMKAMAAGLAARKFDLKWLLREIVLSETYQRASTGETADAKGGYDRFQLRALGAEEMIAALRTATGFDGAAKADPKAQLPGAFGEYVVRHMGNLTDGRGDFQGSVSERLFMNNSSQVRQLIQRRKGNLMDAVLGSSEPWEARVDRMFLTILNRPPASAERERFVKHLASAPKPDPLVEEAIWVLLNSAEFRFNH